MIRLQLSCENEFIQEKPFVSRKNGNSRWELKFGRVDTSQQVPPDYLVSFKICLERKATLEVVNLIIPGLMIIVQVSVTETVKPFIVIVIKRGKRRPDMAGRM